ncbi:MAG TPA: hypothetical protein ENL09_02495, partial [Bacteroidetes bacterium]|nr:hypothetical protein [Bacteroidota bacterium]
MKGWMKITLLVIVIFIAVGSFYYLLYESMFRGVSRISQESYLELNIFGNVPEREPVNLFSQIFTGSVPSLEGLLHCIKKAKIDDKIVGIILKPYAGSIGWAKVEELREALLDFKSTGKPIYVYLELAGNREYYLSTVGDLIFGSPTGTVFINGLLGSGYYVKGTLEKIGIEADFIAHGKYKSAPEIFTRKRMSDAQREVVNAILDDFDQRYKSCIAESRNLPIEIVNEIIDRGLFTLEEAYQAKLIDTLLYFNEFLDFLKKKENRRRIRRVSYNHYKKIPYQKFGIKPRKYIALIYGIGSIVTGIGADITQDGLITSESMAQNIRNAAKDKRIKAIVLRVNSPGGSGTASDIIWREVVEAKKKKPVVVSMSDVAASGGYYISMAADSIVAQPSSIVGSIGVFAGKFSFKGLYEKLGIHKDEIPRARNADLFSEVNKFRKDQRRLI